MITVEEKISELKGKKAFVDALSAAFQVVPSTHSVQKVELEVYSKKITNEHVTDYTYYQEYLVVTFKGGAKSVRNSNGNSNTANLRELGKLVDGGYYIELDAYNALENNGFARVEL